MKLIDSCGWLEFFTDGPRASVYEKELTAKPEGILVPAIVIYEVYKFLYRTSGEETAIRCTGHMSQCEVIDLDTSLAIESAEASLEHNLAMADAIVYATSRRFGAKLVTSDTDLKGLPNVKFVK
jgi:predicted nucleic acid-binding protein